MDNKLVMDIAKKFDMQPGEVECIMLNLGKNGKLCRSRKMIYKAIREAVAIPL